MIKIVIDTNAEEISQAFEVTGNRIVDFRVPLKRIGEYMISSIQNNFLAQGRPDKWAPLSQMTMALRRKGTGAGGPLILRDKGDLFKSIVYDPVEPEEFVRVGTNLPYAKKLHYGGVNVIPAHTENVKSFTRRSKGKTITVRSFKRKVSDRMFNVPARPFVMVQEDDVPVIQRIFVDHIKSAKKEGGEQT